jgi:hypothetical protein
MWTESGNKVGDASATACWNPSALLRCFHHTKKKCLALEVMGPTIPSLEGSAFLNAASATSPCLPLKICYADPVAINP